MTTVLGLDVPFEVTEFDEGVRWTWNVAGVPATDPSAARVRNSTNPFFSRESTVYSPKTG